MAKSLSKQAILCRYMELKGNKEIPRKSKKYRVFENRISPGHFYFIGRMGAVRAGRTISGSISWTGRLDIKGVRNWIEREEAKHDH